MRSVVDAINHAGGPCAQSAQGGSQSNQLEVVVRRHGQVILTAQWSDLLAGADIPIEKDDEIVRAAQRADLHGPGRGGEGR